MYGRPKPNICQCIAEFQPQTQNWVWSNYSKVSAEFFIPVVPHIEQKPSLIFVCFIVFYTLLNFQGPATNQSLQNWTPHFKLTILPTNAELLI